MGDSQKKEKRENIHKEILQQGLEQAKWEEARLAETVEKITRTMEKTRIAEYVEYLERPWKLIWINFLIGIARGLGGTIGLAIVLGIGFFVLQKVVLWQLPFIGDFVTDLLQIIQENMSYLK